MALNLSSANSVQGLEVIPAGTQVTLIMKLRAGTVGVENLCKRTSKGDAEGIDTEYTVKDSKDGKYDGQKLYAFQLLDGATAGQAKAAEITRALLRAIYEAVHAIDPNDVSPEADARRNSATLAGFNGATFLARLEVEVGGVKENGGGRYRDKNVIGKVLRVGDQGYRRLDQPPPMPIERSAPPAAAAGGAPSGTPAVSPTAIEPPHWAR